MHRSRHRRLVPPLVALLFLAACGGATASASAPESQAQAEQSVAASEAAPAASDTGSAVVRQVAAVFEPSELTVAAGTEVVFTNEDSFAHTVTEGTDGTAASDPIVDEEVAAGGEVRVTFDEAGTFDITCRFHPDMQLTVTVEG